MSESSRVDFQELLNHVVPAAQQMLHGKRAFYPFGAILTRDGEYEPRVIDYEGSFPDPKALIGRLTDRFRADILSGSARALAACVNVRIVLPGQKRRKDAVLVSLEHETGDAVNAYIPYRKRWFGETTWGDPVFEPARPTIFT
ncbi:MAG: hypothetical protein WBX15_20295 [Thermoanaerobaculia bacterium]